MFRSVMTHLLGAALALSLTAPGVAAKDQKGKGNKHAQKHAQKHRPDTAPRPHTITAQPRAKRQGLPPGLAKRDRLPPGLEKHLRERGTLPPGLQKRLTPVPRAFGARREPVPPHYVRYFAGPDLVVVDTRTNRIVSIVRNVR